MAEETEQKEAPIVQRLRAVQKMASRFSLTRLKGFFIRVLRVGQLVLKGCRDENLPMHASALTFSTLMSIVPLLAIMLSMSKGLGAGKQLELKIQEQIAVMPEQFQAFVNDILNQVSSANFYAIGGIGGVLLIYMVVLVLSSIESSFNRFWGIRRSRNVLRRVANYISTLVVVPVLMLASGTVTAFFEPLMAKAGAGALYAFLLKYSPMLGTWMALSLLYFLIPNTRVKWSAAFLSGFIAAFCWITWLNFYVDVQPGVSNYNVIYGTLASIPIFLAWLFVSWIIVLLGALFGFAFQNYGTYQLEQAAPKASVESSVLLALAVVSRMAEAMEGARKNFYAGEFAQEKEVSVRLVNRILARLNEAGLVVEVSEKEGQFVLQRSPDRIMARDVMNVIMQDGAHPNELGLENLPESIKQVVQRMDKGVDEALAGYTIRDLLTH